VSSSGTVWTIDNNVVTLAKIASAAKSGSDATLITGTAGTNGQYAQWNADGDIVGVDSPAPSTSQGDVGTYAFVQNSSAGSWAAGATTSGSNLVYAALNNITDTFDGSGGGGTGITTAGALSGTWRNMGATCSNGDTTLAVRTA